MATLNDLSAQPFNAQIETLDGRLIDLPMKMLSSRDFMELKRAVPDPMPPISGVDKQGRPIFNTQDAGYLDALAAAGHARAMMVLQAALQIDIDGATPQERAETLSKTLETSVARQLILFVNDMERRGAARIQHRAETFLGDGHSGSSDMPGAGLDTESLLDTE